MYHYAHHTIKTLSNRSHAFARAHAVSSDLVPVHTLTLQIFIRFARNDNTRPHMRIAKIHTATGIREWMENQTLNRWVSIVRIENSLFDSNNRGNHTRVAVENDGVRENNENIQVSISEDS